MESGTGSNISSVYFEDEAANPTGLEGVVEIVSVLGRHVCASP